MTSGRPGLSWRRAAFLAAALAATLAWSLFLALPHLRGDATFVDRIEAPLTDLRFLLAGQRPRPPEVVVVAMDDAAVRTAGAYPLPRDVLARLVRAIAAARPKALGLDILFLDPGPADAELAAALRESRAVIGMAAVFARDGPERRARFGPYDNLPVAERVLRPVEPIRAGAVLGHVNIATDPGGMARHVPLLVVADGAAEPALPLRLAMAATGASPELSADGIVLAGVATPLDLGASLALRFHGPEGTIRTVSAAAILDGREADSLAGRIVLVGATVLGSGDTVPTPYDRVLPGVELMATAVAHLVRGDALRRDGATRRIDAGLALVLPLAAILLLSLRRIGVGLALVGLLLAALVGAETLLFARGTWLNLALPLACLLPPLPIYLAARVWLGKRLEGRLERANEALLRFHPPALAERLRHAPDYLTRPVEQEAAILFVDLSGFTGLSERLGPLPTQALLKEMHDIVEDTASPRGGSVTSFMGDGAMVLFGLPDPHADDADRALAAALDLHGRLAAWFAASPAFAGQRTGVRIGVHHGPVVLSRLGGARNQHITATGDCVNVTSRLLEIAKAEGASLLASAALVAALRAPGFDGAPAHRVAVRGRAQPLDVHRLA